jgi:hypothetical protein
MRPSLKHPENSIDGFIKQIIAITQGENQLIMDSK